MEYDFSSMSDEELDKALASAQTPAPAAPQGSFDVSAMSDEELNAALASAGGEAPRMTREERIAQNQRAIERAQQPGDGEDGFDLAVLEGVKGAARAVKDIGGGIVGMVSGAARLAGTPVRLATGWEGLHRLADTIDSSYENFGRDALMSEYGENPDGWGYALGRAGEKVAGVAGSLAALGGVGKAVGAAGTALKAAGHAKTAAAVANTLPLMFGNDAAVRAYDTARANGRSKTEAASLAGLNGAIHFLGFKAFENKALNKMLGMPAEMEGLMPKWAGEAAEAGGQSFSSLARGVRNGMIKYTLAERGKGALRAGGIMGLQNFLSDPVMQVAEGKAIDDIDFSRMLKAGAEGVGEGALMEGALGAAAVLKSPSEARKFIADKIFRGKGYKVVGPDGKPHDEPGLLNTSEGRMMLMKQNPAATERILDIVEHGGTPRPAELDAAFLPPDMTAEELKKFASDWRKDLQPYVDEAWSADQPTRPAPPAETAEAPHREFLSAEEAAEQRGDAQAAIGQPPKQETPDETGNGAAEAPAQPEQAEVVAPPAGAEARPVESAEAPAEAADARVVEPPAQPVETAQKPAEAAAGPKVGEDTPKPAEGAEAASRASDATGQNQAIEPVAEKGAEAEAKPGAMSPTQKRNRLAKVQGILGRIDLGKPIDTKALRYGQNNPNGLKLGDLKMLDDPANEGWQYELGLPKERADELRNAVRTAYEEQRAASPNRKDKANESGQDTYSVSASKALERLAAKPNDLYQLALAHNQVSAAAEAASRQGDEQGARFWGERLSALNKDIGKLQPERLAEFQKQQQNIQKKLSPMERKNRQSRSTQEGKEMDVPVDGEDVTTDTDQEAELDLDHTRHVTDNNKSSEYDVSVDESIFDNRTEEQKLKQAEQRKKAKESRQQEVRDMKDAKAKDNAVGNRRIQLETKGGKTNVVWRNEMGEVVKRAPLDALRTIAKASPEAKALIDKLESGEELRFSKGEAESSAERDLRYATDENYQKWLKDRKANDAEPLRKRYEQEQAKAAKSIARNTLPGVDVEVVDRDFNSETDGGNRQLRDGEGRVVGTFDRSTNKVTLYRGATAATLVHELGGHATLRFAEQEAERGNRQLLDRINRAIDEAPQALKDEIRSRYPEVNETAIRDEIWAALRERNSPAMEKAIKTLQGRAWYNRAWAAFRDAWKGLLARMGFNRADLSQIDKMSNDEFLSHLDRIMSDGKTIGRLEATGEGDSRAMLLPGTMQKIRGAINKYKSAGVEFSPFTESIVTMLERGGKKTIQLPGFQETPLLIKSPETAGGVSKRLGLDHSAFLHNWESGGAYSGYYTWPEFDRAFRPYNLKNIQKLPNKHDGQELWQWTVKYPKTDAHGAYELTWRIARNEDTGEMVNLFTTRDQTDYPPQQMKTPEGAHFDKSRVENVADASSSGDSAHNIPNPPAENQGGVRESRAPKPAGYKIMDDVQSKGEKLREGAQDSDISIKTLQDDVGGVVDKQNASGHTDAKTTFNPDGTVKELGSSNVYAAKMRANGHIQAGMKEIETSGAKIDKTLADNGITPEQFDKFLYASHAPERNETVAERMAERANPKIWQKAREEAAAGKPAALDALKKAVVVDPASKDYSGMSTDEANAILSSPEVRSKRSAYDSAAKELYDAERKNLDRLLESGRISKDFYDLLTTRWQKYVPLRTDVEGKDNAAHNLSVGGFRNSEFMTAEGRESLADSPYAFAMLQLQQGLRGAEANVIHVSAANLIRLAESRGLHIGDIVEGREGGYGKGWTFDFGKGDAVRVGGNMKLVDNRKDIFLFKEDGKLKAARLDRGANGRGEIVVDAILGRNVRQWHKDLAFIPRWTGWLGRMRTQYAPEFIFSNALADHMESTQALVGKYGFKDGFALAGSALKWEKRNWKDIRNYIKTGNAGSGYVKEAIDAGVLIKGGVAAQGYAGELKAIQSKYDRFVRDAKGFSKMSWTEKAGFVWDWLKEAVSGLNETIENSTRIGLYSALREKGVSKADAAKFAREATVDFNRKGTHTPWMNGLFMFSNASIQGAMRAAQAFRDDWTKGPSSGPGANKMRGALTSTLVLAGVVKAALDHYLGDDEDREKAGGRNARNLSEYSKKHKLGIPLGGGYQFTGLRMRGPYAAIPYLAQTFTNVALGETSVNDATKIALKELTDQATDVVGGNGVFNDKGEFDGALLGQSFAPTLADPLVQLWTGKDYKGDDLRARSFDKTTPASSNGKRNTSVIYKEMAKSLNWLTGGNEYRKGWLDVAPEDVQFIIEFIGGGLGRDFSNTLSTFNNTAQAATGGTPEKSLSQFPLVRTLVQEYPENTARYYDAMDAYERDKAEFKKTTPERRREMKAEKPYLFAGKSLLDGQIERVKELSHLERGEIKVGQKWVEPKTPRTEEQREKYRKRRLELQAKVLRALGK